MPALAGQRLPENFNAPFFKTDLPAFWRSWHMSVRSWCRTYVYVPMLAKTRSARSAAAAAMAVFALWHELTVGYPAGGAWQALGLVLWYRWLLAGFWLLPVLALAYAWSAPQAWFSYMKL